MLTTATHGHASHPGIIGRKPCLGGGRVELHDDDRRRLRTLGSWLGWAAFALVVAYAILAAL